jgi:hypothetical protein
MREQHLGAGTGGVWTIGDAHACGLTTDEVEWRVSCGEWQAPRRGVYCDGGLMPSPQMRAWAAVLAAGGPGRAWATGRTRLRMLDLPLVDDEDPATGAHDLPHDDVVVRRRIRRRETLHPRRRLVPPKHLGRVAACPTVSLSQAFVDAAAVLAFDALVCALDAALHRKLLTPARLAALVAERRGAPYSLTLSAAVAAADGRAETPIETLGRLVLQPVLPGLVPQVVVRNARGRTLARVDLGDERLRLAVEGDGRSTHTGMAADDRRRDRTIGVEGWHTERYTWYEARRQQDALRARIVAEAARLERRLRQAA